MSFIHISIFILLLPYIDIVKYSRFREFHYTYNMTRLVFQSWEVTRAVRIIHHNPFNTLGESSRDTNVFP